MCLDILGLFFPKEIFTVFGSIVSTIIGLMLTYDTADCYSIVIFIALFIIENLFTSIYVLISEGKRIKKTKWYMKIWYSLTFPIFDILGAVSMLIALVTEVEWKPIPHCQTVSIKELN